MENGARLVSGVVVLPIEDGWIPEIDYVPY